MAKNVITTFLALILTLNNLTLNNLTLIFNFTNYLQTKGCGMGTICATSYANTFMNYFLKKTYIPIYQMVVINLSVISWQHTFIWTSEKKDLIKFFSGPNT